MRYDTLLKRHPDNPLINPLDFPYGNADAVFNCGQTTYEGKTILLLSVVLANDPAPRIHVAESEDGINFSIHEAPLFHSEQIDEPDVRALDTWCIDPRVTRINDTYYIVRPGRNAMDFLFKTEDFETTEFVDVIAHGHNRVPSIFPEKINGYYWKLDRPSFGNPPKNPGEIWISRSPDLIHWGHFRPLLGTFIHWGSFKIGPTPPIRTEKGWLEIIHGVKRNCSTARYSLGAVLLDLENPRQIVGRMDDYLITPETDYEHMGRTPDVIFTCGAIADREKRKLRVYYGGADTCIALAEGDLDAIIDACLKGGD